jgi:hypothetical protein
VFQPLLQPGAPTFISTAPLTVPTTISQAADPSPISQSNVSEREFNFEDDLSRLLRRFFIDDGEKTLRDLTDDPNIVAQLDFHERRLVLHHQM